MSKPNSTVSDDAREEAIGAAWDFIKPKLVEMNHEKGPAGVWSNGYRSGWDAALRSLSTSTDAGVRVKALDAKGMEAVERIVASTHFTNRMGEARKVLDAYLSALEQQPAASQDDVLDILDTIDPDEWAPDPDAPTSKDEVSEEMVERAWTAYDANSGYSKPERFRAALTAALTGKGA